MPTPNSPGESSEASADKLAKQQDDIKNLFELLRQTLAPGTAPRPAPVQPTPVASPPAAPAAVPRPLPPPVPGRTFCSRCWVYVATVTVCEADALSLVREVRCTLCRAVLESERLD